MTELETPIEFVLKAFWDAWPWIQKQEMKRWSELPPEPMEAAIRAYEAAVTNEQHELGGES